MSIHIYRVHEEHGACSLQEDKVHKRKGTKSRTDSKEFKIAMGGQLTLKKFIVCANTRSQRESSFRETVSLLIMLTVDMVK